VAERVEEIRARLSFLATTGQWLVSATTCVEDLAWALDTIERQRDVLAALEAENARLLAALEPTA
jgi:hypothetical protein